MRAWVLAIVLCAVPGVAAAQGLFLQKGTSGYGADMGLSTDGGFVGFGVGGGASYEGWLDGHLGLSSVRLDPNDWDGDVVAGYGVIPGVAIHPLKQSATTPVSVAVGADLGFFTYSGGPGGMSAWSLAGWGTAYRFFKLGSNYGVIPGVQLTYEHGTSQIDEFYASYDHVSVSLGGHFAWLLDNNYILTATPGITFSDETPVFSLNVGALRALP
jgi:hypothetical protein